MSDAIKRRSSTPVATRSACRTPGRFTSDSSETYVSIATLRDLFAREPLTVLRMLRGGDDA